MSPLVLVGEHIDGRADFPAFLVGGQHPIERLQMLALPCAIHFDVLVFVAGGDPHLALLCAEGKGPKEIPAAVRFTALHRNPRIEHVVLRETDAIGKTLEECPQLGRPFRVPHARRFPNAIGSKNGHDAIWIMRVISQSRRI